MIENLEPVTAVVAVIDDDKGIREALDGMLRSVGLQVECFASAQEFLAKDDRDKFGCIVLDVHLPGRNGLDFLDDLAALHVTTPVIVISGFADVPMSVRAMKAGAIEFLTKPVRAMDLLAAVEAAVKRDRATKQAAEKIAGLKADFETLTVREREVFAHVAAGLMNKQIAAALDLSEATIKLHRGTVMRKMRANSLADIVRMADRLGYEPPSLA
ncbi:response regulator transcription factor [Tardiphaga sp. 172_B4_N1_3]|uniref:response regulator transcription factor n=1 Tax=Tardiphaga TaxID=1395974 RepID=UPI0021118EF4|nr:MULTISPECIES: response regulator [Tardiphaga]MDR6658658.1 FixJ family two-component response regulator [Tardiphaga robiniae]